jgi:flagellar basal body P-ring formation protein FlgA
MQEAAPAPLGYRSPAPRFMAVRLLPSRLLPALVLGATAVLLCVVPLGAWAQATSAASLQAQPTAEDVQAGWRKLAEHWINEQLGTSTPETQGVQASTGLRPEVVLGDLDSRLRLAPCNQVEPFLPQGTRLWGRSRIGLRCTDGQARWSVFLPITVRAWGPAWVIRQPLHPGSTLTSEHAELAEIDWAEGVAPVLARPEDWVGHETTRGLMPGQVLREGMVRPPQLFAAGSQVKVLVEGGSFQLTATGKAMGHGFAGQNVRVRLDNGRIVTGTALDSQRVQLSL